MSTRQLVKTLKMGSIALLLSAAVLKAEDEFFVPNTTIGGYGELHYNYSKPENDDDGKKVLDFHRFVLFYAHAWTEKWSLKSEVELEHNFVGSGEAETDDNGVVTGVSGLGEFKMEQAYIDYRHSSVFGFRVGVLLLPIGLINEHHEPPLFLSVERPDYARNIIPTTWFGNGAGLYGKAAGLEYKLTVMEGLDGSGIGAKGIRGGRQGGFYADADQFLYNIAADYTGIEGLRMGASASYNYAKVNADKNIGVTLLEFHAQYTRNDVVGTFEIGNILYDGSDEVESSFGYYATLGYNVGTVLGTKAQLVPFAHWSDYNTAMTTPQGGDSEKAQHNRRWMIGLSVKPIPQVVFKADFGVTTNEGSGQSTTLLNAGAGYMF